VIITRDDADYLNTHCTHRWQLRALLGVTDNIKGMIEHFDTSNPYESVKTVRDLVASGNRFVVTRYCEAIAALNKHRPEEADSGQGEN